LLLYTDGITEARRSDGDLFGEHRLMASLERWSTQPVESLPGLLIEEVLLFSDGRLDDDAAILAVRYVGKAGAH
jgi:serine phosphatase RsbU (regulator of sigma subunit)